MIFFEVIGNIIGESVFGNFCKFIYRFILKPPVFTVGKIAMSIMSLIKKNPKISYSNQYDKIVDFGFEVLAFLLIFVLFLLLIYVIYYIL
jgi:hypothetical protein